MKTVRFSTAVVVLGIVSILFTVGLGGCASSPPPKRPDSEKIKQDSEKSMEDLKKEEDRQRSNVY